MSDNGKRDDSPGGPALTQAPAPDAELTALAAEVQVYLTTASTNLLNANRIVRQRPELAPLVADSLSALIEVLGLVGVVPFFDNPRVAEGGSAAGPAQAQGELHVGPGAGLRRL